jgi:hypothetical protein
MTTHWLPESQLMAVSVWSAGYVYRDHVVPPLSVSTNVFSVAKPAQVSVDGQLNA